MTAGRRTEETSSRGQRVPVSTPEFIGVSRQSKELLRLAQHAARIDSPVLISGEVGTGKSLLGRIIHATSRRRSGPFVQIELATVTRGMAVVELFGHVKGSFTGADSNRHGLLRRANGGTVYLAQIEDAANEVQAALLEFADTGMLRPLGGDCALAVDVHLIASTTQDPFALASGGRFRQDLMDRLSTMRIHVPPLRERREDIRVLTAHFLRKFGSDYGKGELDVSEEALERLLNYSYPGNVGELRSIVQRSAILVALGEGRVIRPQHLGLPAAPIGREATGPEVPSAETRALKNELELLRASTIPAQPIWEGRHFRGEEDLCLVLMPFADEDDMQATYSNHIKKVVKERCGLRCERADDISDVSGVMQSVWESICKARIIIAEMTGRDPSVFYELGIAHTLGKPVIMITQSMDFVPCDLKHLRCIVYEYKPGSVGAFEEALYKTVRNALAISAPPLR